MKNKENLKKNQKDLEGDESLFYFLFKQINIFYEFDKKKYADVFFTCISRFDFLKEEYEKNFKNNLCVIKEFKKKNIELLGVGGYGQVYKLNYNFCIKISLTKKNYYHEYYIAKELGKNNDIKTNIIEPILLNKKKKLTGLINFFNINVLFIYITYCNFKKKTIDENEIEEKLLNYDIEKEYKYLFKNVNRNLVNKATFFFNFLFFYFFNKDGFFINMLNKFTKILTYFKDLKEEDSRGYMMIMPLANTMSSNIYLNQETLKLDSNGVRGIYVFPYIYRMLFLQVSLFFLNVNKTYFYSHNDLKPDNILVTEEFNPYVIKYNNLEFLFKEKFRFKIADFDFSKILCKNKNNIDDNTINKKIENSKLNNEKNWFFDIHFFVHKLIYYIGVDETNLDKIFFLKLYEIFIKPYCKIPFSDLHSCIKVKIKKTNDICNKGYFFSNAQPNISILINFLESDFFNTWRE